MKTNLLGLAALSLLVFSAAASAGVVIQEQQGIDMGRGEPKTITFTLMVQGQREKIARDAFTVIFDLDKRMMLLIDPKQKVYREIPIPGTGLARGMPPGAPSRLLTYAKSGAQQKVAGYTCDEYTGSGTAGPRQISMVGCFSDSAPGAKEFTAFVKALESKAGAAAKQGGAALPQGIPLTTKMTIKFVVPAGLSPEQSKKAEEMSKRPPIVATTSVTKIESRSIPDSEFEPPSGFTKSEIPARPQAAPAPQGPEKPSGAQPPAKP